VDLGFDDDGASEPLGGGFGFGYGMNHFAPRHWHAVARKQGFGLVFVDLHVGVRDGIPNIAQVGRSKSMLNGMVSAGDAAVARENG
jgi:hypothetical protein